MNKEDRVYVIFNGYKDIKLVTLDSDYAFSKLEEMQGCRVASYIMEGMEK